MSNYVTGADALDVLNKEDGGGNNMEFSKFSSGTSYFVKVLGTADLIQFFSYGIYKQVNSFVAERPSKKSAAGNPVEDLTPWDLAWKYYADKSEKFGDEDSQEAYKYKPKQRFAMGFFDLTSGEPIIIDVSKNQAQAIHGIIKKYEKRLDQMAFELSKQGSGRDTTVSLSPVMFPEEDLTEQQHKNLAEASESFDMKLFDGILFEADEAQQIENLIQAGFDISLIGLEAPAKKEESESKGGESAEEEFEF